MSGYFFVTDTLCVVCTILTESVCLHGTDGNNVNFTFNFYNMWFPVNTGIRSQKQVLCMTLPLTFQPFINSVYLQGDAPSFLSRNVSVAVSLYQMKILDCAIYFNIFVATTLLVVHRSVTINSTRRHIS